MASLAGGYRSHIAKTPQSDGVRLDERMEFGVLGPLVVTGMSRDDLLGGPKQRSLVALLLLNANQPVSRDRLIAGIWGEHPPPSVEHTLDNYLSRVRKLFGADRILRGPSGYFLRVEPAELDLERFETSVAEGMRLADGDLVAAAERLSAAQTSLTSRSPLRQPADSRIGASWRSRSTSPSCWPSAGLVRRSNWSNR